MDEYAPLFSSGSFSEYIAATSETDIPPFSSPPLPEELATGAHGQEAPGTRGLTAGDEDVPGGLDVPDDGEPDVSRDEELAAPGRAAPRTAVPDAPGRATPSARPRLTPGPHGRGEPEGQDLSGDVTDTPVSGFHAMLQLPAATPPAEQPAPRSPRAAQPTEQGIPVEWARPQARTTSPPEERIAQPGKWHLPPWPGMAGSGGTAPDGTAPGGAAPDGTGAAGSPAVGAAERAGATNGSPGHGNVSGGAGSTGAQPRADNSLDTAARPSLPPDPLAADPLAADPLAGTGYRRPSRARLLAGVAAVAILGVTGLTGTLVVMHSHQTVASEPAAASATASAPTGPGGTGKGDSASATPAAAQWSSPVPVDPQALPATGVQITGLACPKRDVCYATDSAGTVLSLQSGGTWPVANKDPNGRLIAISCSSSRFCLTVDAAGYAIPFAHGAWGIPALVGSGSGTLTSVSCADSSFCVAVDNIGVAFTYRGITTGWSQQTADPSGQSLNSVSCASSTYCVAVSASGNVFTYNGTSWSRPAAVDTGHDLVSVSCPTTSFCMAVDSSGQAAMRSDGLWGLQPIGSAAIAVSCPSAGSCLAVGRSGTTASYGNGLWAHGASAAPGARITTVSCAAATACVATDRDNNVLFYAPPASG